MSGWGIEGWGIDAGGDIGPQIVNLDPPPGVIPGSRTQAKNTKITFDVIDVTPDLQDVVMWAKFDGVAFTYVIHDGAVFRAPFDTGSTRTPIANGYHFEVIMPGGWPASFELECKAYDSKGNQI